MVIRERLLSFGPQDGLFGILSLPSVEERKMPVVIPNAGIVHRIGPHRLHVRLARHLAGLGHPVLRFDLHGLGDSAPIPGQLGYEEQGALDLKDAIDTFRGESVSVLGLCSGADVAMRAALEDERIARLVLLDPHAYGTSKAKIERMAVKAMDPARWQRAAGRLIASAMPAGAYDTDDTPYEDLDADRPTPPREVFGTELAALTERGVEVLIRYTNFVSEILTREAHFREAFADFDFHDRVTIDMDMETDHTYTEREAKTRLLSRVAAWLDGDRP